jgi:type IV pilus assembly protein PilA
MTLTLTFQTHPRSKPPMKAPMKHVKSIRSQQGFTLIEVAVVTIILVVLTALAIPAIRDYIMQGRVPSSGQDLTKAIVQLKQSASLTPSATPFATLPTVDKLFAGSNFKVDTAANTVKHDLGATAGSVTISSLSSGAAVVVTVWGLAPAACPGLANTVSKAADVIEVGQGGTVAAPAAPTAATAVPASLTTNVVKITGGSYSATGAAAACSAAGENNYMRFYING